MNIIGYKLDFDGKKWFELKKINGEYIWVRSFILYETYINIGYIGLLPSIEHLFIKRDYDCTYESYFFNFHLHKYKIICIILDFLQLIILSPLYFIAIIYALIMTFTEFIEGRK